MSTHLPQHAAGARPARRALLSALAGAAALGWMPSRAWATASPARAVSVGAGVTEIVYALGAESQLVGIDTSSIYPPQAHALPKVGYQRTLTAEGVISLGPQVLLASHEAGPPVVLKQVEAAGIRIVRVEGDYTFDGLVRRIQLVADALGRGDAGQELAARLRAQWQQLRARIEAAPLRNAQGKPLRVAFLMNHGNTTMAAGRGTGADAMLALAGAANVFGDAFDNYKPLSAEALAQAAPDVIVATYDGRQAVEAAREKIRALPGVALTPAGREGRIAVQDIVLMLGFGPRLPQAVDQLYTSLKA